MLPEAGKATRKRIIEGTGSRDVQALLLPGEENEVVSLKPEEIALPDSSIRRT